jgi:4-amino-4-deoxy-L-arabinose transferase-like glycosyltransferase
MPLRPWDEAYLGVHAAEMLRNGNYIVTHSFGMPEMSNTKPPLVVWCMVAASKLVGFSELSIRLPNAIAAVVVCFLLFLFGARVLGSAWLGFLATFCLLSTSGYICFHVVRSGEYDSFLVLFVLIYALSFFLLLEPISPSHKLKLWITLGSSIVLAILTKGIAALLPMPALVVYAIWRKQIKQLLVSTELYVCISAVIIIGTGYYFLREYYNPGYLQAVYDNELGGRYYRPIEGHTEPFWFYIDQIINSQFIYLFPFAVIGIFQIVCRSVKERLFRFAMFCVILVVVHMLVLSSSATKLWWYIAPIFPFLCFLAGIGIYSIADYILQATELPIRKRFLAVTVFILLAIGPAYICVVTKNLSIDEDIWNREAYNLSHYLQLKKNTHAPINGYKVLAGSQLCRVVECYCKMLRDQDQEVTQSKIQEIEVGDVIVTDDAETRRKLAEIYTYGTIETYKSNVEVWSLTVKKRQ